MSRAGGEESKMKEPRAVAELCALPFWNSFYTLFHPNINPGKGKTQGGPFWMNEQNGETTFFPHNSEAEALTVCNEVFWNMEGHLDRQGAG